MIRRLSETLLLRPEDLKPLREDFKVIGVFNPGAVRINDEIVLLARVAQTPSERQPGFVGLPSHSSDGEIVIDWVPEEDLDQTDPRVARAGEVGAYSAGALLLDRYNPNRIVRRSHEPIMQPTADFERVGFVDNVVFPTAIVERGESLCVFYGASDTFTGMVEFSCKELLEALH